RVAELVRASTEQSKALTERTRSTAASARGMLGKTSEVAAAAEQSAVAMREAAQTAAGLIRAIEDARSEVEVAAGVATRAGDQASQAVKGSQALSAHVEAIESILSLIRDISRQTNLPGLQPTIPAARPGGARRRLDELHDRGDPDRHRKCRQGYRSGRAGLRPLLGADHQLQVDDQGVRQRDRRLALVIASASSHSLLAMMIELH